MPDYYAVQGILDENKVVWRAIWEDYETETSSGVFKVNIMLSIAQAEAERTSERIKAVKQYQKEQGMFVGKASIGYKVVNRRLIKDPETEEAVQAIFDTYLKTWSSRACCDIAREKGLPITREHVIKLLHRTAYYGDVKGYKCPAYVSYEDWLRIQKHMEEISYRTPKDERRVYMYSGLCKCGYCGKQMSGHAVKRILADKTVKYHKTYTCASSYGSKLQCPHLQIQEHHIETYLLNNVEALLSDYKIKVMEINDKSNPSALLKRRTALNGKLERLKMLFEEGDISAEDYRTKRDAIKDELRDIVIQKREVPELPADWKNIYNELDDTHRKQFWNSIIDKIIITNENKTNPEVIFL